MCQHACEETEKLETPMSLYCMWHYLYILILNLSCNCLTAMSYRVVLNKNHQGGGGGGGVGVREFWNRVLLTKMAQIDSDAAARSCSVRKVFLNVLKNSQENASAGVSF